MYSDSEERRGFSLRNFLIMLILVIIFVLLLVWLLPIPDMSAINNRIFNANIQEMKNASIPYFTTERLPQKVGDKVTLTLQEMLDLKLLLPFTDKNGDSCDTQNSYVTLEKLEDEYEMRVHLKCNEEEDYIIVKLGCYSYCTSAICEKDTADDEKDDDQDKPNDEQEAKKGPSCVLEVQSGTLGNGNWYKSNVVVRFKSKTTTNTNAKITAYGIGTKLTYNSKTTYSVKEDGTTKVYGYVKDSTGATAVCSIVIKKDTVKPSCKLAVLSGSKGTDGTYNSDVVVGFSTKTDKTSGISAYGVTNSTKVTYNKKDRYTVTTNGTHKIYGYVKDAAGNTAKCDITVTRNAKPGDTTTSTPSCVLEVTSGTKGSNSWYVSNVVVGFKSKKTTNGATITSYGIGKSETYSKNSSYKVTADGNHTVYGYVKDSNGNTATCSLVVKKDATKPSCDLKVTSGTYNSNGYYTSNIVIGFASRKDVTSGVDVYGIGKSTTYDKNTSYSIKSTGKHTVYGYIKDKAGNTNVCSITVEKRDTVYEYQYQKSIAKQYSAWSDWTTLTYDPNNKPSFGTYELIIMEDLGKTSVFDKYEYSVGDPVTAQVLIETGSVTEKTCTGYTYYRQSTSTTTTTTYAVSNAGWQYIGIVSLKGAPKDTLTTKYVYVGADFDRCGSSCTTTPYTYWKKYKRVAGTVDTSTNTITTSEATVKCTSFEEKQTVLFNTITKVVGYSQNRKEVYKDVYQYRKKTRTLIQDAYIDYKWSTYNDSTLLNQGYVMNGNKRVAS